MIGDYLFAHTHTPPKRWKGAINRAPTRALWPLLLGLMGCAFLVAGVSGALASRSGNPPALSQGAHLPAEFKVELYASGLRVPRFVSFSPEGDLYVANIDS